VNLDLHGDRRRRTGDSGGAGAGALEVHVVMEETTGQVGYRRCHGLA
jgi:hypothetical protein